MDNLDITTKFRCYKCKNIVPLDDKFNESLEEDQMCKQCTMLQAYGQRLGLAKQTALQRSVDMWKEKLPVNRVPRCFIV